MKKTIKISEFSEELVRRIDDAKTIDCCKDEIKLLAKIAKDSIGDKDIEVTWVD